MAQRRDTRENPFGARDYNAPSNTTRIGNGFRFTAVATEPRDETDGVPVQDWSSIHVTFYADAATYSDLVGVFRPWRWYSKQVDGQSGLSSVEVGRWIPDFQITVALDPARIDAVTSSHYVWDTRDAEKVYFQLLDVLDSDGASGTVPDFVYAQVFGYGNRNDPVGVSVSTPSAGSTASAPAPAPGGVGGGLASVNATHWSPADGIVTYAAAGQLTCTGWPFIVDDDNCSILGLIVEDENSVITEYVNGVGGVSLWADNNSINISPATPFANTDRAYYLFVVYQEKAYDDTSDSYRTQEVEPLNTKYTAPEYILDLTAVDTAVTGYAPSVDGIVMDGFKDICFQLHLIGGTGDDKGQETDRTLTVTFEGCNELDDGSGLVWVPLSSGYSQANDTTQDSWVSTGNTALDDLVDFDNYYHKRIRVRYSWDDDPDVDPGMVVITTRRKAL